MNPQNYSWSWYGNGIAVAVLNENEKETFQNFLSMFDEKHNLHEGIYKGIALFLRVDKKVRFETGMSHFKKMLVKSFIGSVYAEKLRQRKVSGSQEKISQYKCLKSAIRQAQNFVDGMNKENFMHFLRMQGYTTDDFSSEK